MERRLAAILAADVVGYSRLMELDEAGTLAALRERRKSILSPLVALHKGRIVKLMGDGALVEFPSAVHAVQCAVALQQRMAEANIGVEEDRAIILRIGINLGDVAVEGDDLYGDGVNIAARLEGIAEPETICISGSVYDQVRGKLKLNYQDLGRQPLKNIAEPVQAYAVHSEATAAKESGPNRGAPPLPAKPSIAVLPFDNLSGSRDQDYFSDGITEDINTELSRFHSLFVIARNSSYALKGKPLSEIRQRLGVQYAVQGSVRRLGNRVRVNVQLYDSLNGNELWAERYDRELGDIFVVQEEITRSIVATLVGKIEATAVQTAKARKTTDVSAYDCLLQGIELHQRFNPNDNRLARSFFNSAINKDPKYGLAYAWLSLTYLSDEQSPWDERMKQAAVYAEKSVRLDPNESRCHHIFGFILAHQKQLDAGIAYTEKAIALNPNDGHSYANLGLIYSYAGYSEKAEQAARYAIKLNPYHPNWYDVDLAHALYFGHKFVDAAAQLQTYMGGSVWANSVAAACLAMASKDPNRFVTAILASDPNFSAEDHAADEPFANQELRTLFLEGLLKADLPR